MRRLVVVAVSVVTLAAGAGWAFAGEVKGPATPDNLNRTAAPANANSACAFSGLNDLDSADGTDQRQAQTASDSWKLYGYAKGDVGKLDLCTGGSNWERER